MGWLMKRIADFIKRLGEEVQIENDSFKAIITPFNYRSRTYTEGVYTPLGYSDEATYMIIAPAFANLKNKKVGSIITAKSGEYVLYHSDDYYLFGKCIYSFAYLKRRVTV